MEAESQRSIIQAGLRLIARLSDEPRVRVRVVTDDPGGAVGGLKFEAESDRPTSLEPEVRVSFLHRSGGRMRRGRATFDIREADRFLPPFQAMLLSATARLLPPNYATSWFRRYRFRTTTGPAVTVRVRNVLLQHLGFWRFWFERLRYSITGTLRKSSPRTLEEHEAERRSRGPH